jgi:hypothetical protein
VKEAAAEKENPSAGRIILLSSFLPHRRTTHTKADFVLKLQLEQEERNKETKEQRDHEPPKRYPPNEGIT